MPDKLYQECRAVISGCRAIFEDLREAGTETVAQDPVSFTQSGSPHTQCSANLGLLPTEPAAAETLAEIQQALTGCQGCALHLGRDKLVFGIGNPQARLVLVGEAPGSQEDHSGEPFVGEAGQLLDRILFAMKLSRDEVYICNLIKCRPPGNRDPEKLEIAACETFLKRQLIAIAPELILCLGRVATQTLLQSDAPLGELRGHWHGYEGIPLMPTFHPAYLLRNPAGKQQVWADVKQVMHRLQELNS